MTLHAGDRSVWMEDVLARVTEGWPVRMVACHEKGQIEVAVASDMATLFMQLYLDHWISK